MRFKSKDLMVTVSPNLEIDDLSEAKLCLSRTLICINPTLDPCRHRTLIGCAGCTLLRTPICARSFGCQLTNSCGWDRSTCDPTIFCAGFSRFVLEKPGDLVQLQEQLKELVQAVDQLDVGEIGQHFEAADDPRAIEQALEGALEELRRNRKG